MFALTASSEFADFPQGAPSALALQVAAVAFALSLVRSLRWRRSTDTPEDRIRFLANGAVIGAGVLVGAGALVTEGKVFPDGTLVVGRPAKVVRSLTEEEIVRLRASAENYRRNATRFKTGLRPA